MPMQNNAVLTEALVAASHALGAMRPDATNPHFGNDYITLTAMTEAVKATLKPFEVTVLHTANAEVVPTASGDAVVIINVSTTALHKSGAQMTVVVPVPLSKRVDAQAAAGAITYGRRIGLSMLMSVVADEVDDDGNAASGATSAATALPQRPASASKGAADAPTRVTGERVAAVAARGIGVHPPCPRCGGPMWDNRKENATRKASGQRLRPEFSCKDKSCNHAIWTAPDDERTPAARASSKPLPVPESLSDEYEDDLPF